MVDRSTHPANANGHRARGNRLSATGNAPPQALKLTTTLKREPIPIPGSLPTPTLLQAPVLTTTTSCGALTTTSTNTTTTAVTASTGATTIPTQELIEAILGRKSDRALQTLKTVVPSEASSRIINSACRVIDGLNWLPMTPLMAAAGTGNLQALKQLLSMRADPRVAVEGNGTALMHANTAASINVLLSTGARPNASCVRHGTALIRATLLELDLAALQALLKAGADVNQLARCERFATILEHLLVHRARGKWEKEKDIADPKVSALMVAAWRGNVTTIKLLLAAGADTELQGGPKGYTALMIAIASREPLAVEALLQAKANVDAVAADGSTPRSLANHTGNQDILRMLGEAGTIRQ